MKRVVTVVLALILYAVPSYAANRTLANLRYRVNQKLNNSQDSTETRTWSNTDLDAAINDAILFISHVGLCKTKDTTFALDTMKTEYTMPSDYIKTEGVIIGSRGSTRQLTRSPTGMTPTDPSEMGKTAESDEMSPTQFYDRGEGIGKLTLTPAPRVFDTVRVTYYAYGGELSIDTSHCDLPQAFQVVIPHLAASDLWSKTRTANVYWGEFVERFSVLVPSFRKLVKPMTPAETPGP